MRNTFLAALLALLPAGMASAAPAYNQTASFPLGAPDRWDYLAYDLDTQRLFVAHDTEVTVVEYDGRSGAHGTLRIAGRVTGLAGAHGIVLVPAGKGFVANGDTVTVFDPATLRIDTTIRVGDGADSMAYDPVSRNLYVMLGASGGIAVIDPRKKQVITTINAGGSLEFGAADGQGHLFVNQVDTGSLLRIDTARNIVTATWKMPDCDHPHGLAIDNWETWVFSSCENGKLVVTDGHSGAVLAQPSIGRGSDAVVYDSGRHIVFSSNSDGTMSLVDAVTLESAGDVPTAKGARTMALDPISGRVFLVTAEPAGQGAPSQFVPGTVKVMVFGPED